MSRGAMAWLPLTAHGLVAMRLPCGCHAVAMRLPCDCHAVAMRLPCDCHAVVMAWWYLEVTRACAIAVVGWSCGGLRRLTVHPPSVPT
jgi:hypothetical protein